MTEELYTDHEFDGINEAEAIIASLPRAEPRTVHVGLQRPSKNPDTERWQPPEDDDLAIRQAAEEDLIGIVNTETDDLAAIASDKYDLIQHRDAFQPIIDALQDLGLDIQGRVRTVDGGNYVNVEARVKGEDFNVPEDSDYLQGFFFRNSFDTSSSVGVDAFYERRACSNGMVFQDNVIDPMRRIHIGDNDLVEQYREWFTELLEKVEVLQDRLEEARTEYIVVEKALYNVDFPKSKVDEVKKRIGRVTKDTEAEMRTDRKELYDSMTNYIATEVEDEVAPQTYRRYQKMAEQILFGERRELRREIPAEVDYR